jgi:hypothetical protein
MFNEGNKIHNFISSSGSGTVINHGAGSDFLTCYGSGSGSGSTSPLSRTNSECIRSTGNERSVREHIYCIFRHGAYDLHTSCNLLFYFIFVLFCFTF